MICSVDLFCGIGGLSQGLKAAGIKTLYGLDSDATCAQAFYWNGLGGFEHCDLYDYCFGNISDMYPKNAVRVLGGCPPCQPFSKLYKKDASVDARSGLLQAFLGAISVTAPHIVVMENVAGLLRSVVLSDFLWKLRRMGYVYDCRVVNCAAYGVPQERRRLLLLASRLGFIQLPEPTTKTPVTVSDTIMGLDPIADGSGGDPMHRSMRLSPINMKRIRQSSPGGTWKDWDYALLPECHKKSSGSTYTTVYGRMSWDRPAPTITTQFINYGSGRFGHPVEDRALSLREGSLLQSFPGGYCFGDNKSLKKTAVHIGNAIPPLLATAMGRSIVDHVRQFS